VPRGDTWASIKKAPIYKHTEDLVEAIVRQNKPYILPRPAGSYVSPHQVSLDKTLTITASDIQNGFGSRALLFTNDPQRILAIGQETTITLEETNERFDFNDFVDYGVRVYAFGAFHEVGNGDGPVHSTAVYSDQIPAGVYMYEDNQGDKYEKIGIQSFPFRISSVTSLTHTASVAQDCNVTFIIGTHDSFGGSLAELTHTMATTNQFASYDWTTNAGFGAFLTNSAGAVGTYFAVSFDASLRFGTQHVYPITAVAVSALNWQYFSLWQLIKNSSVLEKQFYVSQLFNPTGFRCLIQNGTPELAKGGFIYGARLPSYAFEVMPGDMDGLEALISSQKHHKLESKLLEHGGNYFYTPEKVQDYFFTRPERDSVNTQWPFGLCLLRPGNFAGADLIFNLNITYSYELITTDISATMFPSASSEILMNQLLYALSKENGWSENPDHIQHAMRVVRNVMASDEMKFALTSLLQAGIKIAPMVISGLLA